MSTLSISHLSKRYGSVTALDDVSLEVADGELLVLLGPSGSGKSTVLKLIAGIEEADSGEISIDGARVDTLVPQRRDIAMVFQSYALYPHMSVFANLAFPLRSANVAKAEVAERVAEVARLLELEELLARRPGQLSGGQQQRVALGRAIVRRPKAFLMDEPLSNLDAQLRARTRLELSRLHERLGATTIYVTHDQVEAMTMGHRIAVIHQGVLHQVDTPEAVYEHPADLTVADFVGSPPMNTLRLRASLDNDTLCLASEGASLQVDVGFLDPSLHAAARNPPAELVLGFRPEHVALGEPGSALGVAIGTATVERVESLGNERIVYSRIASALVSARAPSASPKLRPGARVDVTVAARGLRMFDVAGGSSLGRCPASPGPAVQPVPDGPLAIAGGPLALELGPALIPPGHPPRSRRRQ
jgi:multiple sugar transport system ATP-binding protein